MEDTQNLNDETTELIEKLHEGKMLSHPMIKRLVDRALTTGDSGPLREYIRRYRVFEAQADRNIALAHYQQLDNPFRPYPSRDDAKLHLSGPLKLGFINELDDMFGVDPDVFCVPAMIGGRPGSGKSQLNLYLLVQILRKKRDFNVIIPDLKRTEYRNLLPYSNDLKVLMKPHIKINPLSVQEGMTPSEYITFLSQVYVAQNYLGGTSLNFIIKTITGLYRAHGIFDGSQNYPTMKDFYNAITRNLQNQRSFKYRDILLWIENRLIPYIQDSTFDCQIGIPSDIWRTENIVIEANSYPKNVYSFLVSFIAGLRYNHNQMMGLTGSKSRTHFFVDEAKRISDANRDLSVFDESYFNDIITKTREFGIGFILSSQETTSFNQTIKSISYTKICFPLTDGTDKSFVQESFGLDDDQAAYLFRLPRYGQAIVRYGGYEKPFILAVPHFRIKKHLTDEEVEERMAGFYNDLDARIKRSESRTPIYTIERVPPAASALLHFLHKEPFTNTSGMHNFLKSDTEVKKALDWLEKNEFIHREKYQTSKRGRKSVFAVLTSKAFQYLEKKGIPGKGSFEHSLYQHIISELLDNQGIAAKIEGRIGKGKNAQKNVDVLAQSADKRTVAYEVTLHFENLLDNLHQDLAASADEVVVVTRDQKDLEKAIGIVNKDESLNPHLEKLAFKTISEFFD